MSKEELQKEVERLVAQGLGSKIMDAFLDISASNDKAVRENRDTQMSTEERLTAAIVHVTGAEIGIGAALDVGAVTNEVLRQEDARKNTGPGQTPAYAPAAAGNEDHAHGPATQGTGAPQTASRRPPAGATAAAKPVAKPAAPAAPANTAASPGPAPAPTGQAAGGAKQAPAQTTVTAPDGRQIAVRPISESMDSPEVRRADGIERAADLLIGFGSEKKEVSKHTAIVEYPNGDNKMIFKDPGTNRRVESFESDAGEYTVTTLFEGKKRVGVQVLTKTKSGATGVAIYGKDIRSDAGRIVFAAMSGGE